MTTQTKDKKARRFILVGIPTLGIIELSRRMIFVVAGGICGFGVLGMLVLDKLVRSRLVMGGALSDAGLMVLPYAALMGAGFAAALWVAYAGLCYRVVGPLHRLKTTIRARTEGRKVYLRLREGDFFAGTAELLNREWVAADSVRKAARELAKGTMSWIGDEVPTEERFETLRSNLRKMLALLGEKEAAEKLEQLMFSAPLERPVRVHRVRARVAPSIEAEAQATHQSLPPQLEPVAELKVPIERAPTMPPRSKMARPRGESFLAAQKWLENLDDAISLLFRLRSAQPPIPAKPVSEPAPATPPATEPVRNAS